ncbi:MAG: serine/threonine-protein kinase [Acidobacteriota bacterium]
MSPDRQCPRCAAALDPQAAVCPTCGAASGADEVTRLPGGTGESQAETMPPAARTSRSETPRSGTASGWLSSSDAISHGRFAPGTVLGGRYRIVERLGQGGMGEVFRADDLKLGQAVALKFVPPELGHDPARLMQLHSEVRMARQVAHPNVCRVYDIDEVDGHTFLSMEYVDGENLASLLRRIGRVPEERAVAIARQICAGVGAAHERGVIHRDLKPANVMIDGAGQVRVADFGLAGVAGEALRAGTPAYMAPEQLAGGEVTAQSDVYAIGLVLYELFTGRRALDAANVAELVQLHDRDDIAPPSSLVSNLSPEVDRAVMRCLQRDPRRRPPSARAVAAALPGGDPLAAALAAGETPSPEMVAAAGTSGVISARAAVAGLGLVAAILLALTLAYQQVMLVNQVPLDRSPDVLADRAQTLLQDLGYPPTDRSVAWGLGLSPIDHLQYLADASASPDRWASLRHPWPAPVFFWYRTSPRLLAPLGSDLTVAAANPPLSFSGQVTLLTDPAGRLAELHVMPPQVDADVPSGGETDWATVFRAAGLSIDAFAAVTPEWVPRVFADERRAWTGSHPDAGLPIRIEAGAYRGRLVHFVIVAPWSRPTRQQPAAASTFDAAISALAGLIMPALMVGAAVLARRNLRLNRGDRRGALEAAAAMFLLQFGGWALVATHVPDVNLEVGRTFDAIGGALFSAAVLWLAYLGLEPFVRRTFPDTLIGWSRLTMGQWRDPRVGRDVLIGILVGLAMTLAFAVHNLLPPLAGQPPPMPITRTLTAFQGFRETIGLTLFQLANALQSAMIGTTGLVLLLLWLKRVWLAAAAAVVAFTPVVLAGMFMPGTPTLDLVMGGIITALFVTVILRFGLLASAAALATHFVLLGAPLTTDLGSWRGGATIWAALLIGGTAAAAVTAAQKE